MTLGGVDQATQDSPRPIRIGFGVLVARFAATLLVLIGALIVTAFVDQRHSWNMSEAAIVCPDAYSNAASVRSSASRNGNWCYYHAANGRPIGESLVADGIGERNVFEPRLSFVMTAVVMLATWMGAIALLRLVWTEGKVIRRPRPVPVIPAPE
jgi:hypothetical protein